MTLEDNEIEAIAERVAERLSGDGFGPYGDVRAVCTRFGVSPDFVYAHAQELGAIRLGRGPKARLRFDLARVEEFLHGARHPAPPERPRRRGPVRKQRASAVEMIPFEP